MMVNYFPRKWTTLPQQIKHHYPEILLAVLISLSIVMPIYWFLLVADLSWLGEDTSASS